MGTWLPETCWATCKRKVKDNTNWHVVGFLSTLTIRVVEFKTIFLTFVQSIIYTLCKFRYLHFNLKVLCYSQEQMRSAVFWDVTQRLVVVPYWRFGKTNRSHLQGSRNPRLSRNVASNDHQALRNISEERRSHVLLGESLKQQTTQTGAHSHDIVCYLASIADVDFVGEMRRNVLCIALISVVC